MRVAMIGTGYVGLVSGACFADFGHHVICVDKDASKIAALKRGEMPIYEPGLEDLVASNVRAGRLSFATDLKEPVKNAQAIFIAVGTPSRRGDGHADLTYVYDAAREIAAALVRLCGGDDQVHGPGRHRRRGRAHHPRGAAGCAGRGGVQSGIPARGRRDPRLQAARSHRGRHRR